MSSPPGSRFLVVGSGHSGTWYLTKLLNQQGILTGHESVYNLSAVQDWGEYQGDVSWLAVPFLGDINGRVFKGPIVHVVRDPLKVIGSIAASDLWNNGNLWKEFIAQNSPGKVFGRGSKLAQIATFWELWVEMAEEWADDTQRIEDLDLDRLLRVIGHEGNGKIPTIPTDTNHHYERVEVDWLDLPSSVHRTAQKLGYP